MTDRLTVAETENTELESQNTSLAAGKQQCEDNLSKLRCTANKYLEKVRQSAATGYKQLLQATGILTKNKPLFKKFIADNKITCSNA